MDDEDLIAREDMVVTVTHGGYIKRVPLAIYRAQRRGGKGRSGMATKDEDFVTGCSSPTRTRRCCSSPRAASSTRKRSGACRSARRSRGQGADQHAAARKRRAHHLHHAAARDEATWENLDVMFATTRGTVRRNKLSDFVEVNRNGKIAMKLEEEGDEILNVETCTEATTCC
jgi:DNA gyrase subunit A